MNFLQKLKPLALIVFGAILGQSGTLTFEQLRSFLAAGLTYTS